MPMSAHQSAWSSFLGCRHRVVNGWLATTNDNDLLASSLLPICESARVQNLPMASGSTHKKQSDQVPSTTDHSKELGKEIDYQKDTGEFFSWFVSLQMSHPWNLWEPRATGTCGGQPYMPVATTKKSKVSVFRSAASVLWNSTCHPRCPFAGLTSVTKVLKRILSRKAKVLLYSTIYSWTSGPVGKCSHLKSSGYGKSGNSKSSFGTCKPKSA